MRFGRQFFKTLNIHSVLAYSSSIKVPCVQNNNILLLFQNAQGPSSCDEISSFFTFTYSTHINSIQDGLKITLFHFAFTMLKRSSFAEINSFFTFHLFIKFTSLSQHEFEATFLKIDRQLPKKFFFHLLLTCNQQVGDSRGLSS